MIHFRSFDIIKILKISLPISITLSEKKKIPIIQQREERDGEQKEKERQRKRIKVPSFIRNAVLRRTESESQRPFSPGQLVRHRVEFESGGSNGRRGGGRGHTALAGSGSRDSNPEARCRADLYELGRINNRESCLAGASHIYLSVARNREPRF